MRTEKELWEVVLSRPDLFRYGLCHWVSDVYGEMLINHIELKFLQDILDRNLPIRKYCFQPNFAYVYSFPCREIQPRIDWINKRIEVLTKSETDL